MKVLWIISERSILRSPVRFGEEGGTVERRLHRRIRLRMTARLRWITPLGQHTEVRESEDVSKGGLRLTTAFRTEPGAHLWVAFPFDAALPGSQPEILARILRAEEQGGGSARVALQFEPVAPAAAAPQGDKLEKIFERRVSARRPLALPLNVRREDIPWCEETMTMDISATGLQFLSMREYTPGARLVLSFDHTSAAPWSPDGEFHARVVRVQKEPRTGMLAVAVSRAGGDPVRQRRIFPDSPLRLL